LIQFVDISAQQIYLHVLIQFEQKNKDMKVLIAEDDRMSQKILIHCVQNCGYEYFCSQNGKEAFEIFESERPDVVLTDFEMPEMNGLELLRKIRKIDENTIVIMITGFDKPDYIIKALQFQANDFFQKPFSPEKLISLLTKYEKVIGEREIENRINGMIIQKSMTIQFDNRTEYVPQYVNQLLRETGNAIAPERKLGVHLGLSELILNSIEHGNLDLSYDDKSRATKMSHSQFTKLIEQRKQDPRYKDRRVKVNFTLDESGCEWIIKDEGQGFDWHAVPDPSKAGKIMLGHGRGIFLSRFQFDEMQYMGNGNTVRVKIYNSSPGKVSSN